MGWAGIGPEISEAVKAIYVKAKVRGTNGLEPGTERSFRGLDLGSHRLGGGFRCPHHCERRLDHPGGLHREHQEEHCCAQGSPRHPESVYHLSKSQPGLN